MADLTPETCPNHIPRKHRDGNQPWCDNCGWTQYYPEVLAIQVESRSEEFVPVLFKKSTPTVEAYPWFKNGDHPLDQVGKQELDLVALRDLHPDLFDSEYNFIGPVPDDAPYHMRTEGKIVGIYHDADDVAMHPKCGKKWSTHGQIQLTGELVCPGDWIVGTSTVGVNKAINPGNFASTYEVVIE